MHCNAVLQEAESTSHPNHHRRKQTTLEVPSTIWRKPDLQALRFGDGHFFGDGALLLASCAGSSPTVLWLGPSSANYKSRGFPGFPSRLGLPCLERLHANASERYWERYTLIGPHPPHPEDG